MACQLDTLRKKKILKHDTVRNILVNLPVGLDETYDRILLELEKDEDMLSEARTILQWAMFSENGHSIHKQALLSDVCLFNAQGDYALWNEQQSIVDITLDHLSSLIRVEATEDGSVTFDLAHFTVQEYLLSDRIKVGLASSFALSEGICHYDIAQTCIGFSLSESKPEEFGGLRNYAQQFCMYHESRAELILPAEAFDDSAVNYLLKLAEEQMRNERMLLDDRDPATNDEEEPSLEPGPEILAFCLAGGYGLLNTISRMLIDGVDVNAVYPKYGTALQAACRINSAGQLAVIRALKQAGADINHGGGAHGCPLHSALYFQNFVAAKELLRLGADPNAAHELHGLPIHHVFWRGRVDEGLVAELVRAGADLDALDANGDSALHLVSYQTSHYRTTAYLAFDVQTLVRHGADVNASDHLGYTALHQECQGYHPYTVETLIKAGADVSALNHEGETPLHVACASIKFDGVSTIMQALLDAGADPNACRSDGATPLHLVCEGSGRGPGAIDMLLLAGADIDAVWAPYGSPLRIAAQWDCRLVTALLKHGAAIDIDTLSACRRQRVNGSICENHRIGKLELDQIRSHVCLALLKPDADTSSFRRICGPPDLHNLLRWFFDVAADAAGPVKLIKRGLEMEFILYLLQAGIEVNRRVLRSYLKRLRSEYAVADMMLSQRCFKLVVSRTRLCSS